MDNLQELNVVSVSVVCRISTQGESQGQLSDVLSKHQDNWPRRRIDKLGFYEVDGVRHHIGLEIETHGPDLVILALEAHAFSRNEQLRASTRRRQERKFDEIQSILSELGRLELHSQVYSHMAWTFEADSMKPIIALPMMTIQNPSIPFMEISGVRMKRRTGDGLSTVTLDLREDRSLTVTMMYPVPRATDIRRSNEPNYSDG